MSTPRERLILSSISNVCPAHRERNREVHQLAVKMLSTGVQLNQVVEYCRTAYQQAHRKWGRENDKLNGLA